ncbi:hypothetical protein ISF_01317 [Cordyceps fumosorosea ARSEF 2679]|uniref:Uncharacterized protein n=1 Tax=Cordyceps fumosorosea (strain ARSEF 2679) TaxID=1081104 RepID=A0A162LL83_CORFA|nr:hypothetical protein ISF_01317 [Cordyceps fumosorosea ARSEF 2679]OAA72244.1 hypothetical protein ISF_01317 [Cordyceps fumosorosea ARSEF 2679]
MGSADNKPVDTGLGSSQSNEPPQNYDAVDWKTLPPLGKLLKENRVNLRLTYHHGDVLMVMHTHMLNPRAFLEDTMRYGLHSFWGTGMPWELIDKARSEEFTRCPGETIEYPYYSQENQVLWTACGELNSSGSDSSNDLIGEGYGDGKFRFTFTFCQLGEQ